ncbi:MAG: hypothetical protein JWR67_3341 [Mucilaginibacter sp.]|nr:hypothetical protein [Mucilaginibacter sp.]
MKTIQSILLLGFALLLFAGCAKDNYAAPDAGINGTLIDAQTGGSLELSETGLNSNVRMIVNDPAKYPAPSPLPDLVVKSDGTYANSRIFSESYKVFPLARSGPWQYLGDSTKVTIGQGQNPTVNFKVAPYFYISTPTVSTADSSVTFTITKSTVATITNNLSATNNLLILINNYNIVDEAICTNTQGKYYQNQWQTTVTNASLNTPFKANYSFSAMHLPHGTYYLRVAVIGSGSSGKYNYSPVVKITL